MKCPHLLVLNLNDTAIIHGLSDRGAQHDRPAFHSKVSAGVSHGPQIESSSRRRASSPHRACHIDYQLALRSMSRDGAHQPEALTTYSSRGGNGGGRICRVGQAKRRPTNAFWWAGASLVPPYRCGPSASAARRITIIQTDRIVRPSKGVDGFKRPSRGACSRSDRSTTERCSRNRRCLASDARAVECRSPQRSSESQS